MTSATVPANGLVRSLARIPADAGARALELGLVRADADHVRDRVDQRPGIPAGGLAGGPDPAELGGADVEVGEADVELVGEPGGQRRGPARAVTADDDRHAGPSLRVASARGLGRPGAPVRV